MRFQNRTKRSSNRQHQLNMMAAGIALACIVMLLLLAKVSGNGDLRTTPSWDQPERRPTVSEYLAQQMSRPAHAQSETEAASTPRPAPADAKASPQPDISEAVAEPTGPLEPVSTETEPSPVAAAEPAPAVSPTTAARDEDWPPKETSPAWAPSPAFTSKLGRMVGSLLVIGLITWGSLKLMGVIFPNLGRGGKRRSRAPLMEILEKQTVGPGIQICLVRVAGKHLVVGMTDQSVNLICEIPPEQVEPEPEEDVIEDATPQGTVPAEASQAHKKILAHYLSIIPGMGASRK